LHIKIEKTDGSDMENDEPNTVVCVKKLLPSVFSYLSVSLNGRPVTLHETNYHYKGYIEKLISYGPDASRTYLVSSFW
jgi:hypothetical protein